MEPTAPIIFESTDYAKGDATRPAIRLEPLGDGAAFRVDMSGEAFFRLNPVNGEWLEAEKFFPGDDSKDGLAAIIQGPFRQRTVTYSDGFELRIRFRIKLIPG